MTIPDIASICVAVVVVLGAVAGLVAWFYKRGGQERSYTEALERNTQANYDVAQALSDFRSTVLNMFHDMDKRVTRLEDKQ